MSTICKCEIKLARRMIFKIYNQTTTICKRNFSRPAFCNVREKKGQSDGERQRSFNDAYDIIWLFHFFLSKTFTFSSILNYSTNHPINIYNPIQFILKNVCFVFRPQSYPYHHCQAHSDSNRVSSDDNSHVTSVLKLACHNLAQIIIWHVVASNSHQFHPNITPQARAFSFTPHNENE